MKLKFWRHEQVRVIEQKPSPEAIGAIQEAAVLRGKQDEQNAEWKHHLNSNGFAEMVEGLFILGRKGH